MHIDLVMKVDNENEPDTMFPISLAALEILNRLRTKIQLQELEREEQQTTQRNEGTGKQKDDECSDEQARRYIEHRIRALREFEQRARGK